MSSSHRSRKRQSRLAFTPLSSSSPAAKEYNKQIQDRAAAVTLESSPRSSKRQKLASQLDGVNESFPTPAATNPSRLHQTITEEDSEGEEAVRSTQPSSRRQSRKSSRQQRLDFSNVRDADSFSPPMKLSSPWKPRSSAGAGMFGTQSKKKVVDISSDEESVVETNENGDDVEVESDEELPSPSKLIVKEKKSGSKKSGRPMRATRSTQPTAVDSESEDEIVVSSGPPAPIAIESEDDDDDMPTTTGTQRRQRKKRQSSFISSSPPQTVDSDSDIEIVERPKRDNPRKSSDDDEVEQVRPHRFKPRRAMSRREKEELEEDLDFLEPSSDVESPRRKRDTQSLKKNARQQALDKLKRRRSKQVDVPNDEQDDEGDGAQASFDELYDDDDGYERANPRLKSSQMFREDDGDQDFIDQEEGEDDPLGIPDGVPIEFTRYASMKPKELFKFAVEWFIQKKINPAFSRTDAIYDLTFRKLDDEVAGLAGSKFKSSAWTPDFTMALNARPQIAYEPLDAETVWMHDTCDACNRSGHPAAYQIQFQGKPYYRETLEDVAGNDDEDDNDADSDSETSDADNDGPSYDAHGRQIPAESTIYYVGKFCMSNARTAHALEHWKYHLNEWVVAWLDDEKYTSPDQIVRRDRWNTAKKRKYANKIADRLGREGVVKRLYADFRRNVEDARESKQGLYSWGEE